MQIGCQPVNDLGSPAVLLLPGEDVSSDAPVQQHKLTVDSERGSNLGGSDSLLQLLQERLVSFRQGKPSDGHQIIPLVIVVCAGNFSVTSPATGRTGGRGANGSITTAAPWKSVS